jgi:predicted RNA-binding protein with PIN domain
MSAEQSQRLVALKHTEEALHLATAVRDEWIRQGHTRLVVELDPAMADLTKALTIVRDDHGARWRAARQLLEDVHRTLYRMNRSELAKTLQHTALANHEVSKHQSTISGGSAPT